MTPLRQQMTEDMQLRGLALATQQALLRDIVLYELNEPIGVGAIMCV
jgi:hypothetical protein